MIKLSIGVAAALCIATPASALQIFGFSGGGTVLRSSGRYATPVRTAVSVGGSVDLGADDAVADDFTGTVQLDFDKLRLGLQRFSFGAGYLSYGVSGRGNIFQGGSFDFKEGVLTSLLLYVQPEPEYAGLTTKYFDGYAGGSRESGIWQLNAAPGYVPEPDTWALMAIGFGIIGASMRRVRAIGRRSQSVSRMMRALLGAAAIGGLAAPAAAASFTLFEVSGAGISGSDSSYRLPLPALQFDYGQFRSFRFELRTSVPETTVDRDFALSFIVRETYIPTGLTFESVEEVRPFTVVDFGRMSRGFADGILNSIDTSDPDFLRELVRVDIGQSTGNFVFRNNYAVSGLSVPFTYDLKVTGQAPVPEPSTWLLLAIGFGAVGATARRRRNDSQTA